MLRIENPDVFYRIIDEIKQNGQYYLTLATKSPVAETISFEASAQKATKYDVALLSSIGEIFFSYTVPVNQEKDFEESLQKRGIVLSNSYNLSLSGDQITLK